MRTHRNGRRQLIDSPGGRARSATAPFRQGRHGIAGLVLLWLTGMGTGAPKAYGGAVTVGRLRCELQTLPLGIDVVQPRLSWALSSTRRGERQTAYQVLVARSSAALASGRPDLWDSGRVQSDLSAHVAYGGTPLASRQRVYWKVRTWDKDQVATPYSPPAWWEMGLLEAKDWQASWIGWQPAQSADAPKVDQRAMRPIWCAPATARRCFFRHTLDLTGRGAVRRAAAVITADSEFKLFVNGNKEVGGGNLDSRFELIELTDRLKPGPNLIALTAGDPRHAGGAVLEVRVEFEDGTVLALPGDETWRASADAALPPASTLLKRTTPRWEEPTFDDSSWGHARVVTSASRGSDADRKIVAQSSPAPYLRREFSVPAPVRSARLYATALGLYELWLNGARVGDAQLTPGWTDYNKRVPYQVYDVTSLVRAGDNALGAIVGDGWYAGKLGWRPRKHHFYGADPARLLVQLEVQTADGAVTRVVSDQQWKGRDSAIRSADLLDGEAYDARREAPGWARPHFADQGWGAVSVFDESARRLVADPAPPVRVTRDLKAVALTEPKPGVFVFDMGQNMVGWARLALSGKAGTEVTLRFAEMLNPDGTIYTTNLRRAKVTDRYTFARTGRQVWEPRFTFHGFRYVELTGARGRPPRDAITGRVVQSDTPAAGRFQTSNPLLNKLQSNIEWSQRGNFLSVPTDCPQRDERLGWMGDAQIFVETATFNSDVYAFFRKWMSDVVDAQSPNGAFSDVSPRLGDFNDGSPAWGDAGVIVPWILYKQYGDPRVLEDGFPSFVKWIDYVQSANPDLLWTRRQGGNYGDWLSVGADTDKSVLATAFFAHSVDLVARSARVLGKEPEARRYADLFAGIKAAFNRAYVVADGRIKGDTQTSYVLALEFDLLPEDKRAAAARHLVENIEAHANRLTTGFLGVGHLLPALSHAGRTDVAYRLLMNDTFPSWGYSIKQGATTIWERWDGWTADKGFGDPAMNSFNHYSLGSVGAWMYAHVAGLAVDTDPDHPGWQRMIVEPRPGGGLTSARAELETIYGRASSAWHLRRGTFYLDVTLPPNTSATVSLPSDRPGTEGGRPWARAEAIELVRAGSGETVVKVSAGKYHFAVPMPSR